MKRICALLSAAVLLGLTSGTVAMRAQSDQPSLANVARQKSAAKAKRVVTNDEIPPSPEANNPPSFSAPAASSSGAAPDVKVDASKEGDQPATSAEKQNKVQDLMKEVDSLKTIVKTLQDQIDATDDQNRIASLGEVLQHAKEALAENERQMDSLKAKGAGQGGEKEGANNPSPSAPQTPPAPK